MTNFCYLPNRQLRNKFRDAIVKLHSYLPNRQLRKKWCYNEWSGFCYLPNRQLRKVPTVDVG